jgi:acetamidase/formamidase
VSVAAPTIHIARDQVRFGWDRDFEPSHTVRSGQEIVVETQDASAGQIQPDATDETVRTLDFERVNPVSGPILVEGARPGDVLQVDLLEVVPGDFGWTAQIPGFGLLTDEFPEPWLQLWTFVDGRASFRPGISVPLEPFCGVIGVTPAAAGLHSVVPPRRVGGNMDIRQLGAGATLYLPVEVEGALLGIGDTHGAQGDGEVCGTAIEAAMTVRARVSIRRDIAIDGPEFDVRRPLERPAAAAAGYHVTTGIEPDLLAAARSAVRRMIAHLGATRGLSPAEAYGLCSVAVDLKISEVVDAPNWVVSAFLPGDLFAD